MAKARGKQSTLFHEKETHRRLELFFNRMKVRLQLEARCIHLLCSSFTDLNPLCCVFVTSEKRGIFPQQNFMSKPKPKYTILTENVTLP